MSRSGGATTKDTVLSFFQCLQQGDTDKMRALLAPEATWWLSGELPTSGTWSGRNDILDEFLAAMFARLDAEAPASQTLRRLFADGNLALAEWTSTATTSTQQEYENDYAAVFRVESGRIVEVREYFDTGYAQRVMFNGAHRVGS